MVVGPVTDLSGVGIPPSTSVANGFIFLSWKNPTIGSKPFTFSRTYKLTSAPFYPVYIGVGSANDTNAYSNIIYDIPGTYDIKIRVESGLDSSESVITVTIPPSGGPIPPITDNGVTGTGVAVQTVPANTPVTYASASTTISNATVGANVAVANVNVTDPSLTTTVAVLANNNSTVLNAKIASATSVTGAVFTGTLDVTITGITITSAQAAAIDAGTGEIGALLLVNQSTGSTAVRLSSSTKSGLSVTTLIPAVKPRSVYLIVFTMLNGTPVTIQIENNQAYNDYLHDESGRTEKHENALLTSGYYRGPVDSSTLTRIRQGRGVLLNQPGVSGAMQGSRCCP